MKKILCIILCLVLIVTCLAGFITRTELKENVPLTPIPGVKSSDDYNEDVAYPPVAPTDIAIQRWEMPNVKYNSSEERLNYIYNELGITEDVFQQELLSVEKKYYVNRFYGAGYWSQSFSDYNPNVVITSQEQLDCFFAWYCSPQSSSWSEERLEKALDYSNADAFAENIYRKLSAVDYSESTVIILTLKNRVDGLILHGNAVLGLVDKKIDSRLDGGQFEYTYFYVINNDNLPEDRENLVIVKAKYEEVVLAEMYLTEYGWGMKNETYETAPRELRFQPSWCSIPSDFFCFVKVDGNTEVKPIDAEDNYECEFTPYVVNYELRPGANPIDSGLVEQVPLAHLENTIEYDVLVSTEDAEKYPVLNSGIRTHTWYVATQKDEALSLVENSSGNVKNSDAYALYQKIKNIDFSKQALVFVSASGLCEEPSLESLAISKNNVVVTIKQQKVQGLPTYRMTRINVEPGTVRLEHYCLREYVLVVDKADLPNNGENVEVLVLTKDAEGTAENEANEKGYYLADLHCNKITFEERTVESIGYLPYRPLFQEWLERNKK